MATFLMPPARQRGWSNSGVPAANCLLYTYEAGTTTPKATYQDAAGTIPHTNPIVLDAKGEALIYWDGNYRIDLRTAAGVQITGYPVDNFETPLMASSLLGGAGGGMIGFSYGNTYGVGTLARWLQDLLLSAGASFIGFIQSGVGAILRTMQDKGRENATLFDFIPSAQHAAILAGTSTYDCTADVVAAFLAHNVVTAGPGRFNVSTFNLAANKHLRTAGKATTFAQIAGTPLGTRPINIVGSNVYVGTMTVRGNIATDTNEQNHFVFCQATAATGNLSNIVVGDIDAYDIRGDAVYFGANSPNTLTGYKAGHIYGDNILRNVVSVCGGTSGEILSITCGRTGLTALDVEPEPYNQPVTGLRVGFVKGRSVQLGASSATSPISGVEIGTVLCDPAFSAPCVPAYAVGATLKDGLSLRNVKHARIEHCEINGFDRCGIFETFNVSEIGAKVEFGYLSLTNCSLNDAVYSAYALVSSGALTIERLAGAVSVTGKAMFSSLNNSHIDSANVTLVAGSQFIKSSNHCSIKNGVITGGLMLSGCTYIQVKDVQFSGEILANFCTKLTFDSVIATGSTYVFNGANELHAIVNSTLGGVYYGAGLTGRSYLNTIHFGTYELWVDATGKLRIKGGIPTTDLDGTVVGTQT